VVVGLELVSLLQNFMGWLVEKPHALIGDGGEHEDRGQDGRQ
jgi:hypothetical protein